MGLRLSTAASMIFSSSSPLHDNVTVDRPPCSEAGWAAAGSAHFPWPPYTCGMGRAYKGVERSLTRGALYEKARRAHGVFRSMPFPQALFSRAQAWPSSRYVAAIALVRLGSPWIALIRRDHVISNLVFTAKSGRHYSFDGPCENALCSSAGESVLLVLPAQRP